MDEVVLANIQKLTELDPIDYQYFKNLEEKRTIVFNTGIDSNVVELVYLPLKQFEEDDSEKPVTMYLHSLGGSSYDGMFLCSYLKTYKKKLNIIILGNCCSMAAVIVAACRKNPNIHIAAYGETFFLIHDGMVGLDYTEAKTAVDIMAFNDRLDKRVRDIFINNTNITPELYDSKSRHQFFFFADEAKELGMIDEIIGE